MILDERKKNPINKNAPLIDHVDDDGNISQIAALDQARNPNIIILGVCKMEEVDIEIAWGGKVYWAFPVHQDFSALYIVITYMAIVLIYIFFIYILDAKQNRFADFYKDNRI